MPSAEEKVLGLLIERLTEPSFFEERSDNSCGAKKKKKKANKTAVKAENNFFILSSGLRKIFNLK